jgi:hypothetical protein
MNIKHSKLPPIVNLKVYAGFNNFDLEALKDIRSLLGV